MTWEEGIQYAFGGVVAVGVFMSGGLATAWATMTRSYNQGMCVLAAVAAIARDGLPSSSPIQFAEQWIQIPLRSMSTAAQDYDADSIWFSSRTAHQIHDLGRVEMVIFRPPPTWH